MANEGLAVFNKAGLPSVRDVVAHMRKVDVEDDGEAPFDMPEPEVEAPVSGRRRRRAIVE